jgi:hypothetical protein
MSTAARALVYIVASPILLVLHLADAFRRRAYRQNHRH